MYPAGPAVAGEIARKGLRSRSAASPTSSQNQPVLLRLTSLRSASLGARVRWVTGHAPKRHRPGVPTLPHTGLLCACVEATKSLEKSNGKTVWSLLPRKRLQAKTLVQDPWQDEHVLQKMFRRWRHTRTQARPGKQVQVNFLIRIHTAGSVKLYIRIKIFPMCNGSWAPHQKCRRAQRVYYYSGLSYVTVTLVGYQRRTNQYTKLINMDIN